MLVISTDGKQSYQGSGIVVAPQIVTTNCHVISSAGVIGVYYRGQIYPAGLIQQDLSRDLCNLNARDLKAPPIKIRGSVKHLKVGQVVYAIGNPLGLELTLTEGLVSALRQVEGGILIQISTNIAPGSSGGGLFNSNGALIGITTAGFPNYQGFNFALPADWIPTSPPNVSVEPIIKLPDSIAKHIHNSVMASLPKDATDEVPPHLAFETVGEARAWLNTMSPKLAERMPERRAREEFLVTTHYEAKRAGLDPQLVLAMIEVLSNFRKFAVSKQNAIGYMQVRNIWPKKLGLVDDNLTHLRTNLRYGCVILRAYLDTAEGNLYQSLMAYRVESDPTARRDAADFANSVVRAWITEWRYPKQNEDP